jgi:tRNA pseudouridine13 synthase
MALSAARSLIFNEILAARVAGRNWAALSAGDLANLSGSRSVFLVTEVNEELEDRLLKLDIHPTAPLFGVAGKESRATITAAEQTVVDRFPELRDGLLNARVELATRPTRVVVTDLSWVLEDSDLTVEFSLPPGAFATSVVREVVTV